MKARSVRDKAFLRRPDPRRAVTAREELFLAAGRGVDVLRAPRLPALAPVGSR